MPSPASLGERRPEERLAQARHRFVRRRWARRWSAWRGAAAAALLVVGVGALVWAIFFSSLLAVRQVRVEGSDLLAPARVEQVAAVPQGAPLASVDLDAVRARVEALAPVRSVEVRRSWPSTVLVLVTERTAIAAVEVDGRVGGVDAEGVLFRDYARVPRGIPLLRMGAHTRGEALAEAAAVLAALPAGLARRIDHVQVTTVDDISLQLRDGRRVLWGSADQAAEKSAVLEVLLRQQATVYDVSVPGQPTTRQ